MKNDTNLEELLNNGLQELKLDLDAIQRQKLHAYGDLLLKWNKVYNLTALRRPEEVITHHLLDSLAAVPKIETYFQKKDSMFHVKHVKNEMNIEAEAKSVLDVGCGGGLPGAVWAIACPDWQITCVDAVAKKIGFIRQVKAELSLSNLQAVHSRIEKLGEVRAQKWQLITSRAFSSLDEFVQLTQVLLDSGGAWVALKGKVPESEIKMLPLFAEVFHVEQLNVPYLNAERCLIWMRNQ
jgi:16S rRNA (guanine527-N7)-methyltransferase